MLAPETTYSQWLEAEAEALVRQMFDETSEGEIDEVACEQRLDVIRQEIENTATYTHTFEELEFGSRLAWRNSVRCVGRLYWPSLELMDCRDLESFEEIREALIKYLVRATNGGAIKPMIVVFAPPKPGERGIRIWNEQLIRYAGYRQDDGTVLGDPRQVGLTETIMALGWEPKRRTAFDILPVAVEMPDGEVSLIELPEEAVLEVELVHPDYPQFSELDLRWHALPSISGMRLEIGGISYSAAPFNGWYMSAEIGARNLGDETRYDLLPSVAEKLDYRRRKLRHLWKDRALVALNLAVLHSFNQQGVKIVDHHTVSDHFLRFEKNEASCGREVFAEWSWVVPPISGSVSPLFHRPYETREISPNFYLQDPEPWRRGDRTEAPATARGCPFHEG